MPSILAAASKNEIFLRRPKDRGETVVRPVRDQEGPAGRGYPVETLGRHEPRQHAGGGPRGHQRRRVPGRVGEQEDQAQGRVLRGRDEAEDRREYGGAARGRHEGGRRAWVVGRPGGRGRRGGCCVLHVTC